MTKPIDLTVLTVEKLVDEFISIALEQDLAIHQGEPGKYNRLYRRMTSVLLDLKSRPGDQRRALIPLLQHRNVQVRLKAGIATLALVPDEAKLTLQTIWDRREFPQAADARGILEATDEGRYVSS